MKIIWALDKATVRDVYEELLKHRKIAYTTVMTMMKILETKKYLKRSQEDRAHVYKPSKPKQQVVSGMVREFVNRVFNGSAEPLLMHLIQDSSLTQKELDEITRTVRGGK